jgi:RNA-directed DNA polymerase
VVQTAAKLLLEPIFEADLEPNVFGYRPGRSALGAVDEVRYLLRSQYTDVVDADLSKYLDPASYCPLVDEC